MSRRELYSPLCDTDVTAYLGFLAATGCHGTSAEQSGEKHGGNGGAGHNDSGDNARVCVGCSILATLAASRGGTLDQCSSAFGAVGQFGVEHRGIASEDGGRLAIGGVPGGSAGSCDSVVRHFVGFGTGSGSGGHAENWSGKVLGSDYGGGAVGTSVVGSTLGGGPGGGVDRFDPGCAADVGNMGKEETVVTGLVDVCGGGDASFGGAGGGPFGLCGAVDGCSAGAEGRAVVDRGVGSGVAAVVDDGVESASAVPLGEKTKRNRKWREEKKIRKRRKQAEQAGVPEWRASAAPLEQVSSAFAGLSDERRRELRESRADRLKAENELSAFRAKRQLQLEEAKDFSMLKKRQETFIMRQTEVNKAQVERAFATLAAAGDVPGVVGSVETVVSDSAAGRSLNFSGMGSGSISPNSSVSLSEIHGMQKELLSKTSELEKMHVRLARLKESEPELHARFGFDAVAPMTIVTSASVDENGNPIGEFGDGFEGYMGSDGRFHFGENWDAY